VALTMEFTLVRFTPDPEEVEPVNVAGIVWDRRVRLVVEEGFPRLACVAPHFDRDVLRFYLEGFIERLQDQPVPGGPVFPLSSQFQVLPPRRFDQSRGVDVDELLRSRFLRRARRAAPEILHASSEPVESELDTFLTTLHVPMADLRRRAPPPHFLSAGVASHLRTNGLRFTRVIDGRHHLVVMEGINLSATVTKVEQRAQRIAAGYFQLGKVKDWIARLEKRRLYLAAVVFGRNPTTLEDVHVEFAQEIVRRECDTLVDPQNPPQEFTDIVHDAAADLFPAR
jgi:hypothetical protein